MAGNIAHWSRNALKEAGSQELGRQPRPTREMATSELCNPTSRRDMPPVEHKFRPPRMKKRNGQQWKRVNWLKHPPGRRNFQADIA